MFYNFTEEMFYKFKESRHPKTGNYRLPKKAAEAFYSDIIKEFPKLREPISEPRGWPKRFIETTEIQELFKITSGATTFYDCYFDELEHNEIILTLYFAKSFKELEERVKSIIVDESEEFRYFDVAMKIDKKKESLYEKYADLFDIALKLRKVTHIDVTYKNNKTERAFRSSSKGKITYEHITLPILFGYFKEKDSKIFNVLEFFYSPYKEELSHIVDSKGNVIVSF